jgi:hypothetical protein
LDIYPKLKRASSILTLLEASQVTGLSTWIAGNTAEAQIQKNWTTLARFKAVSNSLTPQPIEISGQAIVVSYDFLSYAKTKAVASQHKTKLAGNPG